MSTLEPYIRDALANIAVHGDTDVFPFPLEKHVFYDMPEECIEVIEQIHADFDKLIRQSPPLIESLLTAVGYFGFRSASQIEPFWNAYFLALVMAMAEEIEGERVSPEQVFSYRYKWASDEKTLFNREYGWRAFKETSLERARNAGFVLTCDIADFYPRIYHHRLDNALAQAVGEKHGYASNVMRLLSIFSGRVSYGLPVGGPASRLLSELLLTKVDRLLNTSEVDFCRYADDYHVFCESREEAYGTLVLLSQKLLDNEGLLLQKTKTRIATAEEFVTTSEFNEEEEPADIHESRARDFLKLRLRFDPYSPTAEEDYESLKAQLEEFDVLGMLGRELRKTRVHQALTARLISALRHVDETLHDAAIETLMTNLQVLYPVLPVVMRVIRSLLENASGSTRKKTFAGIREFITSGSYLVTVPVNLLYTLRVLALDQSTEAEAVLESLFQSPVSSLVKRDIILIMARRRASYWISDIKNKFMTFSEWERSALVVASYCLGDEGRHWRRHMQGNFSATQKVVRHWMRSKASDSGWRIPL